MDLEHLDERCSWDQYNVIDQDTFACEDIAFFEDTPLPDVEVDEARLGRGRYLSNIEIPHQRVVTRTPSPPTPKARVRTSEPYLSSDTQSKACGSATFVSGLDSAGETSQEAQQEAPQVQPSYAEDSDLDVPWLGSPCPWDQARSPSAMSWERTQTVAMFPPPPAHPAPESIMFNGGFSCSRSLPPPSNPAPGWIDEPDTNSAYSPRISCDIMACDLLTDDEKGEPRCTSQSQLSVDIWPCELQDSRRGLPGLLDIDPIFDSARSASNFDDQPDVYDREIRKEPLIPRCRPHSYKEETPATSEGVEGDWATSSSTGSMKSTADRGTAAPESLDPPYNMSYREHLRAVGEQSLRANAGASQAAFHAASDPSLECQPPPWVAAACVPPPLLLQGARPTMSPLGAWGRHPFFVPARHTSPGLSNIGGAESQFPSAAPPFQATSSPTTPLHPRTVNSMPPTRLCQPSPWQQPFVPEARPSDREASKWVGPMPVDGVKVPNIGSVRHHLRLCKPCVFFKLKEGCKDASECRFCHLCEEGEKEKRRKQERQTRRFRKHAADANLDEFRWHDRASFSA